MEDKWTILSPDLSNEPEDWEKCEIEIYVDSCWNSSDFYELEKKLGRYHFRFRSKPKKRTLEEVAKEYAKYGFDQSESGAIWIGYKAFISGFIAARSGEYDDVEVE